MKAGTVAVVAELAFAALVLAIMFECGSIN